MVNKISFFLKKEPVIGELSFNTRKTFLYIVAIVFSILFFFKPFLLTLLSIKTQLIISIGCSLLGGLAYIISMSVFMPFNKKILTKLTVISIVITTFFFAWLMIYGFLMLCFNVDFPEPFTIYDRNTIITPHFFLYKTLIYTLGTGGFTYLILYMYNIIKSDVETEEMKINTNKRVLNSNNTNNKIIKLSGRNREEYLILNCNDFICAKSEGHYINIYYLCDNSLRFNNYVLRNTMKNLEHELVSCISLYRCHKSFFINLDYLASITGNSNKAHAVIKHHPNKIPVSKRKIDYLREVIKNQ